MTEAQTEAPNLEDADLADAARSETGLVNLPTAGFYSAWKTFSVLPL